MSGPLSYRRFSQRLAGVSGGVGRADSDKCTHRRRGTQPRRSTCVFGPHPRSPRRRCSSVPARRRSLSSFRPGGAAVPVAILSRRGGGPRRPMTRPGTGPAVRAASYPSPAPCSGPAPIRGPRVRAPPSGTGATARRPSRTSPPRCRRAPTRSTPRAR